LPANCEYIDMPGNYLPFTDTYLANVADIEACRDECNRQDRYNCLQLPVLQLQLGQEGVLPLLR